MRGRGPDEPHEPGEVPVPARRPAAPPLERPPGQRYRDAEGAAGRAARWSTPAPSARAEGGRARPRLGRGVAYGSVVGTVLAFSWVVPATIFDISVGLVVLAAVLGWLIGVAVRLGAWHGVAPERSAALGLAAATLAVAAWLLGTFLDYLVSLVLLPASAVDLGQRMVNEPFLAWLEPQLVPLKIVEVVLAGLVGWRSAR
jgi:hypothetical protein